MDLSGKRILLTGANRGIGLALARELAKRPTHLLLGVRQHKRRPPRWPDTRARSVRWVHMDLASYESVEASCAALGSDLDRIDVLINNAGYFDAGLLDEIDVRKTYTMVQTNLIGPMHLAARVLPGMLRRKQGKIVNNGSIGCYTHFPSASTYVAGKTGMLAFTNSLRRELQGTGVTLMLAITPAVRTEMYEQTEQTVGQHMNLSAWSALEPADWARQMVAAMEKDTAELWPGGTLAVAGFVARHLPGVFDLLQPTLFQFQREGRQQHPAGRKGRRSPAGGSEAGTQRS
jgi:short-subunit dehydrogenase